jgi:mono/diheme cytochrome c family protein
MRLVSTVLVAFFLCCVFVSWKQKPAQSGEKVYKQYCLSCHMADGGGVPHLNPPLDGSSLVNKNDQQSTQKLIQIVLKGMTDRVPIDGEYYSNNMAAHAHLSNQEIADVLTYIRSTWQNKASAISAKEVAQMRKKLL